MGHDDQILLDELKSGNQSAYELVFKKYYKMLVAKAYFILEDEMEAEDLVQNLFVTIWQKSHFLSVKTTIKAYLFGAVHNQCMMYIRDKKVSDRRLNAYTDTLAVEEEQQEAEPDYAGQLDLIFNDLPVQRQRVFKLVYMDNKKYKEAAEEMGLSVNSIKTHLKLAVKALRHKLIKVK
ncbi:RNA polymerase ECF-type sigma factor [Pedobacter sp. BAL39]|uniref:RNA polymerase sigma factor n=1 Tax=Pedobacter sp. BAL39 TaxID=391596 RepID=UPI0001559F94|nr:sigma-70 family RNA polymerase sigma factor [Pedobacter sp. BAL39]EDM34918.1 RNA polymerase ECF-type sigma factor [Pedobacter sp. BAL39]